MRFYKAQVADVLVVYDDVDVPFGKVKTRMDGGHGGHNGIRSSIAELGSDAFARVKLGVGRPPHPAMDVASFVLADFAATELEQLEGPMVDETVLRIQGIFQQQRNA
jgi:PTH1 family peptidyl-tRNA hydrolase